MTSFFAGDQLRGSFGSSDLFRNQCQVPGLARGNVRLGNKDDVCIFARSMLQSFCSRSSMVLLFGQDDSRWYMLEVFILQDTEEAHVRSARRALRIARLVCICRRRCLIQIPAAGGQKSPRLDSDGTW